MVGEGDVIGHGIVSHAAGMECHYSNRKVARPWPSPISSQTGTARGLAISELTSLPARKYPKQPRALPVSGDRESGRAGDSLRLELLRPPKTSLAVSCICWRPTRVSVETDASTTSLQCDSRANNTADRTHEVCSSPFASLCSCLAVWTLGRPARPSQWAQHERNPMSVSAGCT
jgi:hypothetical protein